MCHYISYAIFILYFSEMMIFKFQNSSSPTFLSSHRKAFRICSRDYLRAVDLDENFDLGLYSEIIQFQNFATQSWNSKIFEIESFLLKGLSQNSNLRNLFYIEPRTHPESFKMPP